MTRELHLVAAARPNLPKLAALWHALPGNSSFRPLLLHTGQHHDAAMFADHLAPLGLPAPEIALRITGGSHAELTGRTMIAVESIWRHRRPAAVVVAGDVDGAMAAALAAVKLRIPLAHLEAGLRNNDRGMPEEVNRRVIDSVADLLWAPDEHSAATLRAEGRDAAAVAAVGNAMVDTLRRHVDAARVRRLPPGLVPRGYGVVTLHRPANVDDAAALRTILAALAAALPLLKLVWPMHPRTRMRLRDHGLEVPPAIMVLPPLGYLDFLGLLARARLVATDSGGVQEEATALDLPCLTLRPSTERPLTVEAGSSRLVPTAGLADAVRAVLAGDWPRARGIPLWDGLAGPRMVAHLTARLG